MEILYVPLDERPCNYEIPRMVVESKEEAKLIIPPMKYLGNKKKAADLDRLWEYVLNKVQLVDVAILSADMLLYGGLVPSRIHDLETSEVNEYINNFKSIKRLNPEIKLYVSDCIMRSPQYNSSEEEPEYYANYGKYLHRRAFLLDKKKRERLSTNEELELNSIEIPESIINKHESRRAFNLEYNLKIASLVKEKDIDFLVIPQDDAAEFGYTAMAQKRIIDSIAKENLEDKIHIYPGADEVGTSLLARALNDYYNRNIAVYVFYSSTLGPTIIPNYEDRPMDENLKYHLDVTKSYRVDSPEEADFILAINSPGKIMEEASKQENRDITYTSFRNLLYFVKKIERFINKGLKVSICDSAFSNGGDLELIKFLDKKELLPKLLSYAGWNTNSNSLGTVLGTSIYGFDAGSQKTIKPIVYRLVEDVLYQSFIRQEIKNNYLPKFKISHDKIFNKKEVVKEIEFLLMKEYNNLNISQHALIKNIEVELPWDRLFEIKLDLNIKYNNE